MKRKQGFTLIELLGVIVVIGVIALITVPAIIGVVDKSKRKALEDSAYGLIKTANVYYSEKTMTEENEKTEFTFVDGEQISNEKLNYKGKVEKGNLKLYSDGKIALCITDGKNVAIKNVDEERIKMTSGRCSYNSITDSYEAVGVCDDLEKEIEELKKKHQEELDALKKQHEEEKKTIEEAYKNQIAELEKRLEELRKEYEEKLKTQQEAYENQINALKGIGNATASQILIGKTALVKGIEITGTMANNGALGTTLNAGEVYRIPAGYTRGGTVSAKNLASQTGATAQASHILSGKTAWVSGNLVAGTMPNRGELNWSPTTKATYTVPAGYYSGGTLNTTGAYDQGYQDGAKDNAYGIYHTTFTQKVESGSGTTKVFDMNTLVPDSKQIIDATCGLTYAVDADNPLKVQRSTNSFSGNTYTVNYWSNWHSINSVSWDCIIVYQKK